jgi:hypothetical protein
MTRVDFSTRIALWVIAVALVLLAVQPFVGAQAASSTGPKAPAGAVPFGIQGMGVFWVYDNQTGKVYLYDVKDGGRVYYVGRIHQLGRGLDMEGVGQVPFVR